MTLSLTKRFVHPYLATAGLENPFEDTINGI